MEYRRVIQEFPNGTNINLIPILTPEEEKARHQRLNDAAVELLLAQERAHKVWLGGQAGRRKCETFI